MKRCPECRRDYYDDTLLYCLDDGNALLEGPAIGRSDGAASAGGGFDDEPQTAILTGLEVPSAGGSSSESATRAQINTTDQTAILQTPAAAGGSDSHRRFKPLLAVIAVIVVAGIGFAIYKVASKKDTALSFESMRITNNDRRELRRHRRIVARDGEKS